MKVMKTIAVAVVLLWLLPGANAQTQARVFRAGIGKVDITPTESLYMGGYDESGRPGPSTGHQGNIYARALVFDNSETRLAFIEIDVVSLPRESYAPIRKLVSTETGIPFDNILLGCVHNHAAPVPGGKNVESDWYKHFNGNILNAVKAAINDLEPVKIGGGAGKSYIAMNRRKIMSDTLSYRSFDENNSSQSYGKHKTDNPVPIRELEGVCRLGANPKGSIDSDVRILRIDKLSGQPKAVFVNYACHGTSLGARNNVISPEWNGHMLDYIEHQVDGVTGIFAQGASGDVNPRFVGGLDGYVDSLENTAALGHEIGSEVVRVFRSIKTGVPKNAKITVAHNDILCPRRYGDVVKDFTNTTVAVPTTAIRIDHFCFVTVPVELFHEIGQTIKSDTHSRYPFLVGYCNGSFGYLPTRKAYSEGGYEPWSSQFDPATEKIFVAGVRKILAKLDSRATPEKPF